MLCVITHAAQAQSVRQDKSKARITDVGVIASDVLLWKSAGTADTTATTETYILWESDGDLDMQAEAHRRYKESIRTRHRQKLSAAAPSGSSPSEQEGLLDGPCQQRHDQGMDTPTCHFALPLRRRHRSTLRQRHECREQAGRLEVVKIFRKATKVLTGM
ncbi:MAG: hypothetical protein IJ606_03135 [Bacteroidaceae bacterium]|nr:hypothetical protein [Bacteroidaceae bacterium]